MISYVCLIDFFFKCFKSVQNLYFALAVVAIGLLNFRFSKFSAFIHQFGPFDMILVALFEYEF